MSSTYHLTVVPQLQQATHSTKWSAGCKNAGWLSRQKVFEFPGTVASYDISTRGTISQGSRDDKIREHWKSGNNVIVNFDLFQDNCKPSESWVKITVKGNWELVGAAPSLPSQRYAEDLSIVAAHPQMQLPAENLLLPNYPNPFNPETWIPYHLAEPADVTLRIYAADGKLIRTLALGHQPAGIYESKVRAAYWDGQNAYGERVASGLYFYTLSTESTRASVTAGDFAATGKMLILK